MQADLTHVWRASSIIKPNVRATWIQVVEVARTPQQPLKKEIMTKDTIQVRDAAHYRAEVTCLNCGTKVEVHPPAGTLVPEYVKQLEMTCPNCTCEDARLVVKT